MNFSFYNQERIYPLRLKDGRVMSNKRRKLPKKQNKPRKGQKTKKRSLVLPLVLGLATIVGGLAAALALLPRVTVTSSDPVDPANPFSASFTITNTGYIPLRSVFIGVGVGQFGGHAATFDPSRKPNYWPRVDRPEWKNLNLGLDEKFTITPGDIFGLGNENTRLGFADIAVVVSYEPPIIPWRREKVFPLIAHKQTNGQFYWYAKPIDSN
jgi:hypothetical protein